MVKPYQDMDLVTFQQRFATEEACRDRLFKRSFRLFRG